MLIQALPPPHFGTTSTIPAFDVVVASESPLRCVERVPHAAGDRRGLCRRDGRGHAYRALNVSSAFLSQAVDPNASLACGRCLPLEVIWSGIAVFAIRTERADISGAVVHQAVTYHFVFPLEAFAAFATRTVSDRTVMGATLAMDVSVRAVQKTSQMTKMNADRSVWTYLKRYWVWKGSAVQPG